MQQKEVSYTKRKHLGDSGKTWGTKKQVQIPKNHPIISFYGSADNAISYAIIIESLCKNKKVLAGMRLIKQTLFNVNAFIAMGKDLDFKSILKQIDDLADNVLPKEPNDFILTYKNKVSAHINFLRALLREHERNFYNLPEEYRHEDISKVLNRLSTLAFNLAVALELGQI